MSFLNLSEGRQFIGKFDLPELIQAPGSNKVFRLIHAMSTGANGVVFRAQPLEGLNPVGEQCAVKFLKRIDPTHADRFDNEVRVLSSLEDPRIAEYLDSGELEYRGRRVPWLSLALGSDNLRRHVDAFGPLSQELFKSVAHEVCDAVSHLHSKGFIHRDIKPENFVWKDSAKQQIFMIDFGIAKRIDEDVSARPLDSFTQALEFVGPVFFSSPELIAYAADKSQTVNQRSDIFQVCKLFWYLATGRISAGVPSARACPFDGQLRNVLLDGLADDPGERIGSMDELKTAIDAL